MSQEALQRAEERKVKGNVEKERYTQRMQGSREIARRENKAFFNEQCKEIEETTEGGKVEISSRKWEISKELFIQR